ncbi:2-oxo acid dehydrogenase subunit E2 [Streptomyces kanamyceticus]|uniref:Acyltransferase n=1 Tax=Streptomyces kanamyceticus TaxID=1967 RepID=A0A5J6GNP8_STRKN|nr:2-oxo acid dehydrogenase subunit E2 [Streptomyces kanamyceticus]QEU95731.1 acyltransferase [Streptomyces kanamyceticus]
MTARTETKTPGGKSATGVPVALQRRHTLHFLREIRSFSPVFLDTEVDMARVVQHRAAALESGQKYSLLTYVLHASARTMAAHPEANAGIRGRLRPRVARFGSANAKVTLDKAMGGQRIVLSTVLPGLESKELLDIQKQLEHFRDGDPETMPEFAGVRKLQQLPVPVGRALFRRAVRPLHQRPYLMGTYAVTSLGHRPVDGFHSVGGTTVTLGVGRVTDRPVARHGKVEIAPVMRLNLAFDHRVIDGAEAADILADMKEGLESFSG